MFFCFVLKIKCLFKPKKKKKKTYLFLPFDYNSLYIYQFLYPSLHRLQTKGKRETRKKETKNIKAFCLKRENTNTRSTQFSLSLSLSATVIISIYGSRRQRRSSDIHKPIIILFSNHSVKPTWCWVRFLSPGLQDESTRRVSRVLPAPCLPLLQEPPGLALQNRGLRIRSGSQVALCCCQS